MTAVTRNAFQSAPDKKIGRTQRREGERDVGHAVSIRARQKNRANRPRAAPRAPPGCFNPRPTKKSGEPTARGAPRSAQRSFNPRPTKKSGEPMHQRKQPARQTVSIRARQKNRANPWVHLQDVAVRSGFQSAPDKKIGRTTGNQGDALQFTGFNPRPTKKSGEPTAMPAMISCVLTFQSAPDKKIGRTPDRGRLHLLEIGVSIRARQKNRANPCARHGDQTASGRFNPRPTKKSGEPPPPVRIRPRRVVSIRARQKNRANHIDALVGMNKEVFQSAPDKKIGRTRDNAVRLDGGTRFNPRPTKKSGEPAAAPILSEAEMVSIRARQKNRANPTGRACSSMFTAFQSAPDKKIGRTSITTGNASASSSFQSAPDKKIGRTPRPPCRHRHPGCFNPRPTKKSGEPRLDAATVAASEWFQSAPDKKIGRTVATSAVQLSAREFQSAPDKKIGRTSISACGSGTVILFQSAPDKKIGRTHGGSATAHVHRRFQSAPDKKIGRTPLRLRRPLAPLFVSIRARQKNRANHSARRRLRRGAGVSIRARQKNRANHCWSWPSCAFRRCFNPRPTKKSGEPR